MGSNIVSGIAQLVIHDIEVGAAEDEVGMFSSARDNEGAGIASESTWSSAVSNSPLCLAVAVSPCVKREDVHKYLPKPDMTGYFYLFQFLPIELRAKIWDLILPQPRVLSLVFNVSRGSVKVYSEYHRGIVYQGAWMIETKLILNMPLLAVC
ncbi:uncharacterized protein PAC_19459 [Phialocephala subalpina]|uniref:2EXR domain-containing protein n=1 Tax=Phialocephala subalpina TaxID=576137 RepID=A0A1L7XX46_9HELO|nr:uncharacterized protein PAC_19459 [Phialocephala subalpina]